MKLTGMQFRFKDDPWCRTCIPNEHTALLVHEEDNRYDEKAMAVQLEEVVERGHMLHTIGYLTAARNTTFQDENDRDWGYRNLKDENIVSVKVVDFWHKTPRDHHTVIEEKGEFVKKGDLFNKRGIGSLNSVTVEFEIKEDDGEVADRSASNMMGITRFLSLLPCDEEGQERFDRWKFDTIKKSIEVKPVGGHDEKIYLEYIDKLYYIAENGYDTYRNHLDGLADDGTEMHDSIERTLNRWEEKRKCGTLDEFIVEEGESEGIHNFLVKYHPKVLKIEKNVEDKELMLRGRFDCLLEIDAKRIVVDWKSGRSALKHKMQGSFYANCEKADEAWIVSFKTENKQGYSVTKVNKPEIMGYMGNIINLRALCESLGIIK